MTKRRFQRQWSMLSARPRLVDGLLAVAIFGWSFYSLFAYSEYLDITYRPGSLAGVGLVAATTLPLAVRRRFPLATSLTVSVAAMALGILEYSAPLASATVLFALYSAGAYTSFRRGMVALAAAIITTTIFLLWFYDRYPELREASSVGLFASLFATVGLWGLGRGVRNRRRYLRALEDRAQRLERTRVAEVRAAVAEERARIARELHDVVAHHVSVMTVQAAAARRTLAADPQRSREAMEAVESTGRAALVEMRRLVEVLRGPDDSKTSLPADRSPQPGLADLPNLVDQLREAGMNVWLHTHGEQRDLSPGTDVTVFRVVQEALTNTLKHAGVATVGIDIRFSTSELELSIVDNGNGAAAYLGTDQRPGHGLIGMRERVTLYGGSLQAGPRRGGGFEVTARLPLEPHFDTKVCHEPADPRPAG